MDRSDKLAVLIPVFNGGSSLRRSIASCAAAELRRHEYEIIVVDNCSTDDAVSSLPPCNSAGAPVHVFRNETNVGRVENWNRAMDVALSLGFRYATFLFAGDCWTNGSALRELLKVVRQFDARAGFAPFVVTDSVGTVKYESRRFYVTGNAAVCSAHTFLATMLQSGMFPLGPLQANIYRVDQANRPWFDPEKPTRADVLGTLDFIQNTEGQIVIGAAPFLKWREHAGRFHASMGPAKTIEDYMETFNAACVQTQLPVNYARAKARLVLNSCRLMSKDAPVAEWPRLLSLIAGCCRRTPYRMNPFYLVEALWLRFALGRHLLQFG